MKTEKVEELEREAKLIRAWIRDVTGPKRARLREIRAILAGMMAKGR